MYESINLRKANFTDAQAILDLVKALAIYEKSENEVKTSVADYENGLRQNVFGCILAEIEGKVVGMALYFKYFSTWNGLTLYLEDFIVLEEYRRHGIGKLLFEAYLEEAKRQQVKLTKWQVLSWNELAKSFYRKYDAQFFEGWDNCIIRIKL